VGRDGPAPRGASGNGALLSGEAGVTLVESLLSSCLLLLGLLLSLSAYDGGKRSLARSESLAEQQQAARTAFDQVVAHARAAGLDVNPDFDPARPDEAVEAAFATAVVLRGDFDGSDPAEAATPEASLSGGAFETVPTGNDEIVTYALAKGDGTDTGSLTFDADVRNAPRDGTVETVTVSGITLAPVAPPYTLYRITLNNDVTKWGTGTFVVKQPVLEGVASLTLRYWDALGVELDPASLGGTDTAAARLARSRIRRIGIEAVSLTGDPVPGWTDPDDPDPATRSYRKLRLRAEIAPRNQHGE
jgi:hypothetical protein